jgi:hypothetical protein
MLRRRARIDAYLDQRVRGGAVRLDADLHDLLRLGAAQLLQMQSVPAYAAIAQTVELAKRRHGIGASKLANAVLRRLDRERDSLTLPTPADPVDKLVIEGSHPRWLVARWVARWGVDETQRLLDANNREAPLVARPAQGSRHGHPVIFDRHLFAELRAADLSHGARAVIAAHLDRVLDVPVTDAGAFLDIDTPDEYLRCIGLPLDT